MINVIYKTLIFILLLLIITINAFSQEKYKVRGIITDAETNEPLPGAGIRIENSTIGTITDENGKFELKNIEKKEIVLVISYISYETQKFPISFEGKNKADLSVQMKTASTELDQVTVKKKAEGQIKAMLSQKLAINIKNVISSEQIEKFPDLNAAEAMARIPGITIQRDHGEGKYVQLRGTPPELTNFNINGEQIPSPEGGVRYVGMDIISAEQVDFIEITKVLTPDMDADGIGGSVNIITKKAESEIPEINASVAAGYNNLRETGNYQLQFSYGQKSGKLSFNVNSNYYYNSQGTDNIEFKYTYGPFWGSTGEGVDNYHIQYREVQLRHYNIIRKKIGLSATLNYEFKENFNIYITGMHNRFTDDELRRRLIYKLDDAINFNLYYYGDVERDIKDRIKNQQVNSVNLGGDNDLKLFKIDYEIAYSEAIENQPDRLEALFDSPGHGINILFDDSDKNYPKATFPDSTGYAHAHNYEEYDLDKLEFQNIKIIDKNNTAKLNFTFPFAIANNSGYFKFGGKTRYKYKTRDIDAQDYAAYYTNSLTYPDVTEELSMVGLSDGFADNNLLDQGYVIDHMPSPDLLREFYQRNPHHFIYSRTDTKIKSIGEDYRAEEYIYALYGMVKYDYGNLMILGGIRYERTDIDYRGMLVNLDFRGNYESHDTIEDKRTHQFFLPQFQMKYKIDDNTNVRFAVTRTFSRPNFDDVLPVRYEKDIDDVKYGNPDLKYPQSLNFDLLGEKYLKGGGIISGGIFFKRINEFIFYQKANAHEGFNTSDYPLKEIEKPNNGIKAFVYGAELQSQFKFGFLPGFLKNFGLFLTYTYTYSEAKIHKRFPYNDFTRVIIFGVDSLNTFGIEGEEEKLTLPGQAEHTVNFAFFYESKRLYMKISTNYHDEFLNVLGTHNELDEYYDKAWYWDFTANYSITKSLKVFTDIKNLTNAPLKYYLGTPDMVKKYEFYSWWGRIGVKLKI